MAFETIEEMRRRFAQRAHVVDDDARALALAQEEGEIAEGLGLRLVRVADHARDFGHGGEGFGRDLRGATGHHDGRFGSFASGAADRLSRLPHGFLRDGAGVHDHEAFMPRIGRGAAHRLRLDDVEPAAEGQDIDILPAHAATPSKSFASKRPSNSSSTGPVIRT